MESNEQTNKENKDRLIESRMTPKVGRGGKREGLSKKKKGFMCMGNGGDCWGEGRMRGLNDNGKIQNNEIKLNFIKEKNNKNFYKY